MKKRKIFLTWAFVLILLFSATSSLGLIKSNNKEPVNRGAELEITTDYTFYEIGDEVIVFFTNIGDDTLSGGGPTVTIYNEDEEIVYQEACYCWWELEPGEYEEWIPWDQTDQQGSQVPIGLYTVEGFLSGNNEDYIDTTTIHIVDYDPPGPPTGPTEGVVDVEYEFCFNLPVNPDGDSYYVRWVFGDGIITEWGGPFDGGQNICEYHSWDEIGVYEISVGLKDIYGAEYWSNPLVITIYENIPPGAPIIEGPTTVRLGTVNTWTFVSNDPEEHNITYYVDWGDVCGGAEYYGPYESGEEVELSHRYYLVDTWIISSIAIDENGAESEESYHEVTITKNRNFNHFFFNLIKNNIIIYQLLSQILKL